MHSVGAPKVVHTEVHWDDVMAEMRRFFRSKVALAETAGLSEDRLILDPGIDFAKQREDNLRVFAGLEELGRFERPILLPGFSMNMSKASVRLSCCSDGDSS